ncbi:MAG TPA: YceI family protein [Solirubrobacteraceae bacterium]|nr:YceI family protein [Solirubrobacteraceae bacterium]
MPALPEAGVWAVDRNYSSVRFAITHHAVTTFRSGFTDFDGAFDAPARVLSGSARVASVQAFPPLLRRLAEADFFDFEAFPEMRFASTSIEQDGDGGVAVAGALTIRDVTLPVRATGVTRGIVPVTHFPERLRHEHFGLDLELTIDRRDYGVSYNNELADGRANLGFDVAIEVALELARTDPIDAKEM